MKSKHNFFYDLDTFFKHGTGEKVKPENGFFQVIIPKHTHKLNNVQTILTQNQIREENIKNCSKRAPYVIERHTNIFEAEIVETYHASKQKCEWNDLKIK